MGFIDCHVHVWTDDLQAYPLAPGFTREQMKPAVYTPADILTAARPCGVDRVVLVQMSYYGTDNSYMLATMRCTPGVFGGIAVIDEGAADLEAEMGRLGEQGVRGFRIQPQESPAGEWLDTPGYHRMFEQAAQTGQSLCCLIDAAGLPALDRMCAAYPASPVVIDHLCRIGVGGEISEAEVAALCDMARHESVKVKVSAFYALGGKRPPHDELLPLIARVYEAFGAQRLMWASDCPFQVQNESYEDGLALVRDRFEFASPQDREWLLWRTAEETFF
jgi:predicted TIM-barrel fold metal-dependent hydrolase